MTVIMISLFCLEKNGDRPEQQSLYFEHNGCCEGLKTALVSSSDYCRHEPILDAQEKEKDLEKGQ